MKKWYILKNVIILFVLAMFVQISCKAPWQDNETTVMQPVSIGRSAENLTVYFGLLHNHSNYSDGTGSPANGYVYARDTVSLDFFGFADHAESVTTTAWASLK